MFGWENEFKELHKGIICGISATINGRKITKWDGADPTNFEATKGGISNSMKRAAVQWKIGRYLYSLKEEWVVINERRQNDKDIYVKDKNVKGYFSPPKLPNWALPNGNPNSNRGSQEQPHGQGSQTRHGSHPSNNNSNHNQKQQSNQRTQPNNNGQNHNKKEQDFDRNKVLRTIREHEDILGLHEADPKFRIGVFNKANPNTKTQVIEQATENELQLYFWALQPVSVMVSAAKHYGVSMEQLMYYAQIKRPNEALEGLYSLFFKFSKEEIEQVINMMKAERNNEATA